MNEDALLNDFAVRCFRDVADQDYIAARLAYRSGLIPQFHWLSLQAIEKYLKAILLFNRVPARYIGHDLAKALKHTSKLPFTLRLSEVSKEFIEHLDRVGRFRYLEVSYHIYGPKLVELDKTVWEIRRYCKVMNYEAGNFKGGTRNMLDHEVHIINEMEKRSPHLSRVHAGLLEKIIDNKKHAAREALLWQNAFFGKKPRKKVRMFPHFNATNSPLYLHPELLDEIEQYVFLPEDVKNAYREMAGTQIPIEEKLQRRFIEDCEKLDIEPFDFENTEGPWRDLYLLHANKGKPGKTHSRSRIARIGGRIESRIRSGEQHKHAFNQLLEEIEEMKNSQERVDEEYDYNFTHKGLINILEKYRAILAEGLRGMQKLEEQEYYNSDYKPHKVKKDHSDYSE